MNKLLIFILASLVSTVSHALVIDLFINNPTEIIPYKSNSIDLRIHDLSAADRLNQEYLPTLPADPELAKKQAVIFFNSERGTQYKKKIMEVHAYKSLLMKYRIAKTPAIVFNEGEAVIYGISDVDRGLSIYRTYLQEKAEKENE